MLPKIVLIGSVNEMNNTITYRGNEDLISLVKKDGYFILRNFFDPSIIQELRESLGALLDADEAKRDNNKKPVRIKDKEFRSTYVDTMHTFEFPAFKNELLAECILKALDFEPIKKMLLAVVGPDYRMRIDIVRRSTGLNDMVDEIQLPHFWHNDAPGEFTFGIFLDDMSKPNSGGTAVIPSTHSSRFNPSFDFIIGPKVITSRKQFEEGVNIYFPEEYLLKANENKKVSNYFKENSREITGGPGDLYFFLNDTFHGRWHNKSGKKLMAIRFGGFSSAFKFKDDKPRPYAEHRLAKQLENLYGPKPKIPWNDDILLCHPKDNPQNIEIFENAVIEKQQLFKEFSKTKSFRSKSILHKSGRLKRKLKRRFFK